MVSGTPEANADLKGLSNLRFTAPPSLLAISILWGAPLDVTTYAGKGVGTPLQKLPSSQFSSGHVFRTFGD